MSRSIPPSVVYPSPNEWPVTVFPITGITKGLTTTVTCPNHGFTNANNMGIAQVDFSQVKGMQQINGKNGTIVNVINSNTLQIDIDSSTYQPYISGGFINVTNYPTAPFDPLTNTFP